VQAASAGGHSHIDHDTGDQARPPLVRSDSWQHHGPPCTARDLSVRLDVDVTIGSRTIHDCAEGPIRADHEIAAIRAAALAGRAAGKIRDGRQAAARYQREDSDGTP